MVNEVETQMWGGPLRSSLTLWEKFEYHSKNMEYRKYETIRKICYIVHLPDISKAWERNEKPGFFETHTENENA